LSQEYSIAHKSAEAPEARHNVAQPVRAGTSDKEIASTVGATNFGRRILVVTRSPGISLKFASSGMSQPLWTFYFVLPLRFRTSP
jgi:hypothetical protein